MTANTVITAVRKRLGDSKLERWDDETLLLYVSLCQNDICMHTNFYRKSIVVPLVADQYVYTLPADYLAINRLEYRSELLPIFDRNDIDHKNATYPLVLKDNLEFNQLQFVIGEEYEDLAQALINVYGVTIASDDCELEDVHGVVTTVDCDPLTIPPVQPLDELLVYYTAVPPLLAMDVTDPDNPVFPIEDLLMPDIWFQAFLHYVCGMALQDDNDANNIQRGELEGTKYLRILAHIQKSSSKDFTSNVDTKSTTRFRRI